jgi:hypothetical protein
MLSRNRRDWFPIVATDMFCSLLAAVIILDAVSPKEIADAGRTIYVRLEYKKDQTKLCDRGRIVLSFFDDGGSPYSTLDEGQAIDGGEICIVEAWFPDAQLEHGPTDAVLLVAEYASKEDVEVQVSGSFDLVCHSIKVACDANP